MNNRASLLLETEYRVIALAFASFIMFGAATSLLGIAWPSIQQTFNVPLNSLGLLLIAPTIASLVTSFYSGRIIAKLTIAPTLTLACLLIALGLGAYGLSPSWTALVLSGALLGGGFGLLDSSMNAFFTGAFGPRLMNWLHASFGVGAIIGPVVMTAALTNGLGWQWSYIAASTITLLLVALLVLTRDDWIVQYSSTDTDAQSAVIVPPIQQTLRQPLVWVSVMLFFLFGGIETTAGNWSYSLFTLERGVDTAQAGLWVSAYWATFTVGRILFGFFANRLDAFVVVRWCIVGALVSTFLLWWNPANWVGFAGLAILGFAQAPIFPLMVSSTPRRLGYSHAINAIGFQIGAAGLGVALVPSMAGVLAGAAGLEAIGPLLVTLSISTLVLYQAAGTSRIKSKPKHGSTSSEVVIEDALS
ncbi:MAG: MFS transporter [Aggregatilineales bacterium]